MTEPAVFWSRFVIWQIALPLLIGLWVAAGQRRTLAQRLRPVVKSRNWRARDNILAVAFLGMLLWVAVPGISIWAAFAAWSPSMWSPQLPIVWPWLLVGTLGWLWGRSMRQAALQEA